jgi:hypothetical protein
MGAGLLDPLRGQWLMQLWVNDGSYRTRVALPVFWRQRKALAESADSLRRNGALTL